MCMYNVYKGANVNFRYRIVSSRNPLSTMCHDKCIHIVYFEQKLVSLRLENCTLMNSSTINGKIIVCILNSSRKYHKHLCILTEIYYYFVAGDSFHIQNKTSNILYNK